MLGPLDEYSRLRLRLVTNRCCLTLIASCSFKSLSRALAGGPRVVRSVASPPGSAGEAAAIAQEAYIYLYPLILMDITRKQMINCDPKVSSIGGPANEFVHVRTFPPADVRAVVRPNFDTLYSSAWLDLTSGPVVVSTADTEGRYFLLPSGNALTLKVTR